MTRLLTFLLGLLFILQTTSAQDKTAYDKSKTSTDTELDFAFTDKRGIESKNGIIYYVEKDKKTLTAYENEKIKWQTNIIEICGQPAVGQPEIRYVKLDNDTLSIVFGKHSLVSVDISNGKTTYLGAD